MGGGRLRVGPVPELQGEVDRQDNQEPGEGRAQVIGIKPRRESRGHVGRCHRDRAQGRHRAQMHRMPLVVAQEADQHVGGDHHQGRPLGQVLIHPVQIAEDGDRDQAPADAEQAACHTQAQPEQQICQNRQDQVMRHTNRKARALAPTRFDDKRAQHCSAALARPLVPAAARRAVRPGIRTADMAVAAAARHAVRRPADALKNRRPARWQCRARPNNSDFLGRKNTS